MLAPLSIIILFHLFLSDEQFSISLWSNFLFIYFYLFFTFPGTCHFFRNHIWYALLGPTWWWKVISKPYKTVTALLLQLICCFSVLLIPGLCFFIKSVGVYITLVVCYFHEKITFNRQMIEIFLFQLLFSILKINFGLKFFKLLWI